MDLKESDQAAAAVAKAPRVTLDDIKNAISSEYSFTAGAAIKALNLPVGEDTPANVMTICVLILKNGFTVIGKSAPASRENFDEELGHKFAKEDAMRQMWGLMGFALRDKLNERENSAKQPA